MAEPQAPYALPLPAVHPDNAPYWAALREHELRLQRCEDCAVLRFPRLARLLQLPLRSR